MMKTKTWILLLSTLLFICLLLSFFLLRPTSSAQFAEILSDGRIIKTVDLRIDQVFTVFAANGGHNTVTVKGGKIAVTEATCPDHYCMERGYQSGGAQIVCLPNRMVIRFLGEQEIDISLG